MLTQMSQNRKSNPEKSRQNRAPAFCQNEDNCEHPRFRVFPSPNIHQTLGNRQVRSLHFFIFLYKNSFHDVIWNELFQNVASMMLLITLRSHVYLCKLTGSRDKFKLRVFVSSFVFIKLFTGNSSRVPVKNTDKGWWVVAFSHNCRMYISLYIIISL